MSCWFLTPLLLSFTIAIAVQAGGQDVWSPPPPSQIRIGSTVVSGSLRVRVEGWDWFLHNTRTRYAYGDSLLRVGIAQPRSLFDWKLEFGQSTLFALPATAFASGDGAPLGLGASYFAANGRQRNAAGVFLKQGYISYKGFGENGSHLRLGRFEFGDGLETAPHDETLAWLKRERLAERLIGDADWTAVGRSFDGLKLSLDRSAANITFLAARPTEGVYQTDGLREVDLDVLYAAYTREIPAPLVTSELRLFAAGYHDGRPLVKSDNRTLLERQEDFRNIRTGTFGGHFVSAWGTPLGKWEALLWGAFQTGRWGVLDHRAGAVDVELGWRPPRIWGKPWLRATAFRGTGDHNPTDRVHETFFQMLPTSRTYARIPFYTFQNTMDFSGQVSLQLHKRLSLHSEIHKVKLTEKKDLWYLGTGAFQNSSFGYEGIGGGGRGGLANFLDLSLDYHATSHWNATLYVAALSGKAVMTEQLHGRKGGYAYLELLYRF